MVKGRPRKATNLLELNGAYKKNPQRKKARANEPKPKKCNGAMPDFDTLITEDQALQMILDRIPDGVKTDSDDVGICLLAKKLKRAWNNEAIATEEQILHAGLGRLGMYPSDRSRLQVAPEKKLNRFAALKQ